MEAIVLAGGLGTRLRQTVPDVPKPMAPVGGRPFLEILLALLEQKGFHRIVLSLGYMAEKVIRHFDAIDVGLELCYELEKTPLGTGGALRAALERCAADHVYVFNGDTYLDVDAAELERHWQQHRNPIVVGTEVPEASRYGKMQVDHGRLIGFIPKGQIGPGLINAGCYVFPREIFQGASTAEAFSLEADWLAQEIMRQRFDIFVSNGFFIDIGVPEDYQRAQEAFAGVCS